MPIVISCKELGVQAQKESRGQLDEVLCSPKTDAIPPGCLPERSRLDWA